MSDVENKLEKLSKAEEKYVETKKIFNKYFLVNFFIGNYKKLRKYYYSEIEKINSHFG